MKKTFVIIILSSFAITGWSEVIARYNFNHRISAADAISRIIVDGPVTTKDNVQYGPPYIPNPKAGECGPALLNPFLTPDPSFYYRSFYEVLGNRESLVLRRYHYSYRDTFMSAPGKLIESGPLTLEMVLCLDEAAPSPTGGAVIFDMSPPEQNNVLEAFAYREVKQSWDLRYTAGRDATEKDIVLEAKNLSAGRFYHIAVTDDGVDKLQLYVDGKAVASAKREKGMKRSRQFGIICRPSIKGDSGFITGKIDAIVIHNAALAPDKFELLPKQAQEGTSNNK